MSRRVSLPGAAELFRVTGGDPGRDDDRTGGDSGPAAETRRPGDRARESGTADLAEAPDMDPVVAYQQPDERPADHPSRRYGGGAVAGPASRTGTSAPAGTAAAAPPAAPGGTEPVVESVDGPGHETVGDFDDEPEQWPPARPLRAPVRRRARSAERRPTGRERHEEKITVYCSADELIDLEQARLTLRGEFGLAVDRGRIVREAVAVVLADLEAKGHNSILVRRLRGRS